MLSGTCLGKLGSSVGLLLAGFCVVGMVGCGGGNPFDHVKVSGTVTYEDGSLIPAEQIQVKFLSQADSIDRATNPRPGIADVDPSTGQFSCVSTLKYGDGLILGPHKVQVVVEGENGQTDVQVTPSEIEVGPDSATFDFRVKKQ